MDPVIQFAGVDEPNGGPRKAYPNGGPQQRQFGSGPSPHGFSRPPAGQGQQPQEQQQRGQNFQRPQSARNPNPHERQQQQTGPPAQTNGAAAFAVAAAMAAIGKEPQTSNSRGPAGQGQGQALSWQQQQMLNQGPPARQPRPSQHQEGQPRQPQPGMQQQQQQQQQSRQYPNRNAPQQFPDDQKQQQQAAYGRPQSARPAPQGNQQQPRPQGQWQGQEQAQGPAAPFIPQQQGVQAAGAPLGPKPVNATALQHHSDVRFDSLNVSPLTKKAMAEVFRYEFCTKVQAQAIPISLTGVDVLAKAKTGTGKTIAFMIPAIEKLLFQPPKVGQVGVVVLSPTRELAMQIHSETEKLLRFHKMKVQFVIGGTNINAESRRLQESVPQLLVGTPGRFLDHLSNNSTGLEHMMKDLRMLVLDEADNILDMGFRPTIEKILALMPNKNLRQTQLFSATFPHNVKELANFALRSTYSTVDTVGEEISTNVQVEQMSCVVPHKELMLYLSVVIKTHMQQDPHYKVIVFFPTARMTQLYSETFQRMNVAVLEMHSRKSQAVRTRMSDDFRAGSGVLMFSSDVSARGVDYPDVSLVVQVGLPSDKDQYVHRVGRTSRAGKTGQSLLLLADFEQAFLNKLKGLPIRNLGQLAPAMIQADAPALAKALTQVSADTKGKAYAAWLGFYKSAPGLSMSVTQVVETANEFSRIIGCSEPPELEAKTIGKMGLKGVPGLRVQGRQANRPESGQGNRPPPSRGG